MSPERINPHSPRRKAERLQAQISLLTFRQPGPRSLPLGVLTPDDVVDLEHLGRARIDSNVLQDRHEALPERIELRLRVPDLADSELPVRLEGDVELESFREPIVGLLQTPNRLVVLLGRDRGWSEADEHARCTVVHRRCCRRGTGGHEWPPSYGCLLTEPTYNRTRLTGARLATEDSEPERHPERITVSRSDGLTEATNIGTRQLDGRLGQRAGMSPEQAPFLDRGTPPKLRACSLAVVFEGRSRCWGSEDSASALTPRRATRTVRADQCIAAPRRSTAFSERDSPSKLVAFRT